MKVSFNQNFWHRSNADEEIEMIQKRNASFQYGGFAWQVPAIYCFEQGFTMDICRQIPRADLQAFFDEWSPYIGQEERLTPAQLRRIERENKQNFHVDFEVQLFGKPARIGMGCGICWQPCVPAQNSPIAEALMQEYALDETDGWQLQRFSFFWPDDCPRCLDGLCLKLSAERVSLPFEVQFTAAVGCKPFFVPFSHPENGQRYQLEILSCKGECLAMSGEYLNGWEWPNRACMVEYRVIPSLPKDIILFLHDCAESDRPVRPDTEKAARNGEPCGVIGGADGVAFLVGGEEKDGLQTACSALHFTAVSPVDWRIELQATPCAPAWVMGRL